MIFLKKSVKVAKKSKKNDFLTKILPFRHIFT